MGPSTHTLTADRTSCSGGDDGSLEGTPVFHRGVLLVQPLKGKSEGCGGGKTKTSGVVNQTSKGYLELGGDRDTQLDVEDDEVEDEVEELINLTGTEGSLRSEFIE